MSGTAAAEVPPHGEVDVILLLFLDLPRLSLAYMHSWRKRAQCEHTGCSPGHLVFFRLHNCQNTHRWISRNDWPAWFTGLAYSFGAPLRRHWFTATDVYWVTL